MRAWGIALLCLLTVVAGCSTGRATGEEAVANLHRLYTAGNYAEIYRSADPEYQKAGTESDNTRFFEGLVRTLGAFKTATPAGWRTFVGTGGRQITLVYESEFQKGHAKETFVWRLNGDQAALIGYHVDSPLFVTQLRDRRPPAADQNNRP